MKLKIRVTKDVLNKSKYCGIGKHVMDIRTDLVTNCAIALAVRDVWPKARVECAFILPFGRDGFSTNISLPSKISRWINKFDESSVSGRARMKPIEFEIEVPAAVISKINIDEIKPLLQNHPTLELV